ncbi:MAG: hemolysin family protein [Synergistaceae bacterium]|jgi:CBS domain containing-hemolysin-like protein|nr:hemolysin family protein [Synergistaceae bacterium]
MFTGILIIVVLMLASSFFSMSEISLAASRRVKLRILEEGGESAASSVLSVQEQPGVFFTTIQIGVNGVAILAGIVGDSYFSPPLAALFPSFIHAAVAHSIASALSFAAVTMAFVFFADLIPKRIAMIAPETVAMRLIGPMKRFMRLFSPFSRSLNTSATVIFRHLGMPEKRNEEITSDEIYAVMEAGALSGVLRSQEKELIGNVFELDTRTVPSAMTTRENIVYFDLGDSEEEIKAKVAESPHSVYLVCSGDIDHVKGYVNSKDLLARLLNGQSLTLGKDGLKVEAPMIIPDTLTLAEAMDQFRGSSEDIAVVLNEYALVVGIISLKDIMAMLMGNLVGQEEQIMKRDDHSWLVEGATPIDDVMRAFDIEEFPNAENYETIGGFLTYMLRRIPHRTDFVNFAGYKFEVIDIDNYKIDQILVTRLEEKLRAEAGKNQEAALPEGAAGSPEPSENQTKEPD